jgi:hypothetical protein
MPNLLAAAALTVSGLLPVPVPLPTDPPSEPAPHVEEGAVAGDLEAADGRLKRGCKQYAYAYAVTTPSEDWTFDITMTDRNGKGVNAQSLIGPNDAVNGVLTYRLCRWATVPGRFTLKGVLVSYEGSEETTVEVTEAFRLRRRNP